MASNNNQRLLEELEALDEAGTLEGLNPDLVGVTSNLLRAIGEDPAREGLVHTPVRVAKAWHHLTRGYRTNVDELINDAVFSEDYDEMVTVKNIRFYSLCEHHLLPFWGSCSVAYIPNGKVIGLSKIPRIVDMFSRRLQIQERLCQQIAQTLDDTLNPKGVAVVMEGFHMCMMMRGVEKEDSRTTTSAMRGVFKDNPQTRNEFLDIVRMRLAD